MKRRDLVRFSSQVTRRAIIADVFGVVIVVVIVGGASPQGAGGGGSGFAPRGARVACRRDAVARERQLRGRV